MESPEQHSILSYEKIARKSLSLEKYSYFMRYIVL